MKTINRMLTVFMAAILMLGSMYGRVLTSEEAAPETSQEEPSSEIAVVPEEFPLDTEIPEEAVTDGEPDELDAASEFGTWTDPETGEEYEILSSVEDILPEEFTEDEITEGLQETIDEIAEDIPEETPEQEAEAAPEPENTPETEPVGTQQPEPEEPTEEEVQEEPLEAIEEEAVEEPFDEPAVEVDSIVVAADDLTAIEDAYGYPFALLAGTLAIQSLLA